MQHNCAVCFDYLFDSVRPISVLQCGHTIHAECLQVRLLHATFAKVLCS